MLGAGTIINPILKVLTTVAILGAIYIFFVKPALDTTEKISGEVNENIQQAQQEGDEFADQIQIDSASTRALSYKSSLSSGWPKAANEVQRCVDDAGDDLDALESCAEFAKELVFSVQSDRSTALSYADSLSAQGNAGAAKTVNACVEKAGFKVGAMQHCSDLAYKLLFG